MIGLKDFLTKEMKIFSMTRLKNSAISPQFFLEYRDIDDFVNEYGFHQWRFNFDVPYSDKKTWIDTFREWLNELGPVEKKKAISLLESGRIKETLIKPLVLNGNFANKWKENAALIHQEKVDFFVGDVVDPYPFELWTDILPSIRESRNGTLKFKATVSGIVNLLKPLLISAPSIYIVDPFFLPGSDKETELLRVILREISGSCCYRIHVITRDLFRSTHSDSVKKKIMSSNVAKPEQYYELLNRSFKDYLPSGRSVYVHLVDDRLINPNSLLLHERFVINRYGALRFDKGLTMTERVEEACVVDRRTQLDKWTLYSSQVVSFDESLPLKDGHKRPVHVDTHIIK